MEAHQIKSLIEQVVNQRLPIDVAVAKIIQEMGRGPRTLVVDEHLFALERELAELNYHTSRVDPGLADPAIKLTLRSKVFVTQNGQDFCDPGDLQKYDYGLIWLKSGTDAKVMAKKVEAAMMTHGFKANLNQCVTV